MKKTVQFFLDFLLILGALVCIFTINGGRWLIENPAFYQSGELPTVNAATEENAQDASLVPVTGRSNRAESACYSGILPGYEYWDASFLILKAYRSEKAQEAGAGSAGVCR